MLKDCLQKLGSSAIHIVHKNSTADFSVDRRIQTLVSIVESSLQFFIPIKVVIVILHNHFIDTNLQYTDKIMKTRNK